MHVSPEPLTDPRTAAWLLLEEVGRRIADDHARTICALSRSAACSDHPQVQAALAEVIERLARQSGAYSALRPPHQAAELDLSAYLEDVCARLVRAVLAPRCIRLTLVEEPVMLDRMRCWRVGLLVSELIAHAARDRDRRVGRVGVSISAAATGRIECRVADDRGCGAPPGANRIVNSLAADLCGELVSRTTPRGSVVTLSFPR